MNLKERDKLCKKLRRGGVMTDAERLGFLNFGLHRFVCAPHGHAADLVARDKGLIDYHEDLLPDFGNCDCHDRTVTYNGRVLRDGR